MSDWSTARVVQPEEWGTRAKCMWPECSDKLPQIITHTDLVDGVERYWLPCGHAISYSGSWVKK
jgi:hypothetical protein